MKRVLLITALLVMASVPLFAHPGHVHTYMGTVSMLHGDNTFMMETAKGDVVTVQTDSKTAFVLSPGNHKGKMGDLEEGMKVVVKMSTDGKTATSITMSKATK